MKQSAYTKYRNKILKEIKKQQNLGLDLNIELPLTERQLRRQGVQGAELRKETIRLKKQLPEVKGKLAEATADIHKNVSRETLDLTHTDVSQPEEYIKHPRVKKLEEAKEKKPLTEAQKQKRKEQRKRWWENLTAEEKERVRQKRREQQRKRRANLTEEQREAERAKARERYRRKQYERNKERKSSDEPEVNTPATGIVVFNTVLDLFIQYLLNGFPEAVSSINTNNQSLILSALNKAIYEEGREALGERVSEYTGLFDSLYIALYDSDDLTAVRATEEIIELLIDRQLTDEEQYELGQLNEEAYDYETV